MGTNFIVWGENCDNFSQHHSAFPCLLCHPLVTLRPDIGRRGGGGGGSGDKSHHTSRMLLEFFGHCWGGTTVIAPKYTFYDQLAPIFPCFQMFFHTFHHYFRFTWRGAESYVCHPPKLQRGLLAPCAPCSHVSGHSLSVVTHWLQTGLFAVII